MGDGGGVTDAALWPLVHIQPPGACQVLGPNLTCFLARPPVAVMDVLAGTGGGGGPGTTVMGPHLGSLLLNRLTFFPQATSDAEKTQGQGTAPGGHVGLESPEASVVGRPPE